jgi:hypothetical protein
MSHFRYSFEMCRSVCLHSIVFQQLADSTFPSCVKLRAEAVDPVLQIRALRNGIVALTAQPTGTVLFAINACPLLRYG